jgi:hypothetical protein
MYLKAQNVIANSTKQKNYSHLGEFLIEKLDSFITKRDALYILSKSNAKLHSLSGLLVNLHLYPAWSAHIGTPTF